MQLSPVAGHLCSVSVKGFEWLYCNRSIHDAVSIDNMAATRARYRPVSCPLVFLISTPTETIVSVTCRTKDANSLPLVLLL